MNGDNIIEINWEQNIQHISFFFLKCQIENEKSSILKDKET